MHEMPVVLNVVSIIDDFARENQLPEIRKVVVEIGLASAVVPFFFQACWDPAIANSDYLLNSELEIIEIPASCRCLDCGKQYTVREKKPVRCPACRSSAYKAYSGTDIQIKEIRVDEETQ